MKPIEEAITDINKISDTEEGELLLTAIKKEIDFTQREVKNEGHKRSFNR